MILKYVAEIFIMLSVISVDAFATAFSFGTNKIIIPIKSLVIIHIVNLLFLTVSFFCGFYLIQYIPSQIIKLICSMILLLLGVAKFFEGMIKNSLKKTKNRKKDISFSVLSLNFILSVYSDPKTADADSSKTLSPNEAFILALTLSADGFPIGLQTGLSMYPIWAVLFFSVVINEFSLRFGNFLGKKLTNNSHMDFSAIGGLFLIIIAIGKLF